jgi:hypothetical protein
MSQQALMTLAREATGDFNSLIRIQALTDDELLARGLAPDEVEAVRQGFLERLALAGSFEGDDFRPNGCCN